MRRDLLEHVIQSVHPETLRSMTKTKHRKAGVKQQEGKCSDCTMGVPLGTFQVSNGNARQVQCNHDWEPQLRPSLLQGGQCLSTQDSKGRQGKCNHFIVGKLPESKQQGDSVQTAEWQCVEENLKPSRSTGRQERCNQSHESFAVQPV
jgi:hypothetical protein